MAHSVMTKTMALIFFHLIVFITITSVPINVFMSMSSQLIQSVSGLQDFDESNPCLSKETCSECITSNAQCAWCKQDGFSSELGRRRCDYVRNLDRGGCHESQIYHPGHFIQKLVDEELSNKTSNEYDAVQMRPQRIHLRLKPKSPYILKVGY